MFNKKNKQDKANNSDNKSEEDKKETTTESEENNSSENSNENSEENKDKNENTEENENSEDNEEEDEDDDGEEREPVKVLVKSKTSFLEKVVVVYQRVKPNQGPEREVFNIYQFDNSGKCIMPERDAILFWKDRKKMVGMEDDISVFSEDEKVEYDYKEVKNLVEIEIVSLSNSEQPKSIT